MRGILKPNGYPQHHIGSVTIFAAGREFVVDEKQESLVIDKSGSPLRLSPAAYEHFRGEFGKALVCEPIGASDGESAAKRIAELEAALLETSTKMAARIAELEQELLTKRDALIDLANKYQDAQAQLAAKAPKPEKPKAA